ncbi:MAG: hypothetical protein KatS3mg054_0321 [Chloroflexus sp.]|nr:MAG: hypothetical protein KatS3mg054_0321 [Chloroflexus sp.]
MPTHVFPIHRSVATEANPFARALTFILTDFLPNANRQAIPVDEAERIIASAKGMPIKYEPVNEGHAGAFPIGVIERVWSGVDPVTNQPCIYASAVLWESEYPDIVAALKREFETTGTLAVSWELMYQDAEEQDGVEWLRGVTVIGVAIVEQPAYGTTRTRVLTMASQLEHRKSDLSEDRPEQREVQGMSGGDELVAELERLRDEVQRYRALAEQAQAELRLAQRKQALAGVLTEADIAEQEPLLREVSDDIFALYQKALLTVAERAVQRALAEKHDERVGGELLQRDLQREQRELSREQPIAVANVTDEYAAPRGYPRPSTVALDETAVLLETLRRLS